MTTGSQQLAADYTQLKALLELQPRITVVRVEGDPPDHYELAYQVRGYVREETGEVGIGATHQVRLDLPFGYPHSAPIATPLTPISTRRSTRRPSALPSAGSRTLPLLISSSSSAR